VDGPFVRKILMASNKIVFVTNEQSEGVSLTNQSIRYRCIYPSFAISQFGAKSEVVTIERLSKNNDLSYDTYIFHSPIYSYKYARLYKKLKALGKLIIADYDDLILDLGSSQESIYAYHYAALNNTGYPNIKIKNNLKAATYFNHFISANRFLSEKLQKILGTKVNTIHLGMPTEYINNLHKVPKLKIENTIAVAFGSSASAHTFLNQIDVFERILNANPLRRLVVLGDINLPKNSISCDDQLILIPRLNYLEYIQALTKIEKIVVLQGQKITDLAKSRVKPLEANILGLECFATRLPDYEDALNSGLEMQFITDLEDFLTQPMTVKKTINIEKIIENHGTSFLATSYKGI
jgi:hypothetical protein